ncbi:uncharacterized protein EI90DRAFT_3159893 [Cantharellus anzutake]|uniref:uncharacterized protein n=1 Tax=Cantharellus anzutake TaxID=1750568 RepID=UPI001906D3A3|nr:uncharacterized protein EI90DRAFT_3159893 [Cantharellus anzutake]KAF8312743.1 hypothetical protein EI90DRAFT_3159893 [Cantharellus anzutake]
MSSTSSKPTPSGTGWLDPALLPAYGIALVALIAFARYVDKTYIRPPSKTGFGKGAPGFLTNTRKIKVTPEIAERLRRGERVSPEEIEEAVRAVEEKHAKATSSEGTDDSGGKPKVKSPNVLPKRETRSQARRAAAASSEPENEWIPGHVKKGTLGRRRKK